MRTWGHVSAHLFVHLDTVYLLLPPTLRVTNVLSKRVEGLIHAILLLHSFKEEPIIYIVVGQREQHVAVLGLLGVELLLVHFLLLLFSLVEQKREEGCVGILRGLAILCQARLGVEIYAQGGVSLLPSVEDALAEFLCV